jgi:hypothetical protein
MKRLFSILLTLALLCTAFTAFAEAQGGFGGRGGNGGGPGGNGGMGGGGGSVDKSGDAELQAMIEDVVPKYQLLTFEDAGVKVDADDNKRNLGYFILVAQKPVI